MLKRQLAPLAEKNTVHNAFLSICYWLKRSYFLIMLCLSVLVFCKLSLFFLINSLNNPGQQLLFFIFSTIETVVLVFFITQKNE
jgi:FtsH-binding integral membrane protein